MELLKDFEKKGWSFEVIKDDIDVDENRPYILLRIKNNINKNRKIELKAAYISYDAGVFLLEKLLPEIGIKDGDCLLPAASFVDQKMYFNGLEEVADKDKIDIELWRVFTIRIIRNDGKWYVKEVDESFSAEELKKRIEHFDSIEEKFGIRLQNFSVNVLGICRMSLFCEVLATDLELAKNGFNIEVAVYDKNDNVVDFFSINKYRNNFVGFEVFSFGELRLNIPLEEISKIRFYPTR